MKNVNKLDSPKEKKSKKDSSSSDTLPTASEDTVMKEVPENTGVRLPPIQSTAENYRAQFSDEEIYEHGSAVNILFQYPVNENPPPSHARPSNYKEKVVEAMINHYSTIPSVIPIFVAKTQPNDENDLGCSLSNESTRVLFGWCQRVGIFSTLKSQKAMRRRQKKKNSDDLLALHCYLMKRFEQTVPHMVKLSSNSDEIAKHNSSALSALGSDHPNVESSSNEEDNGADTLDNDSDGEDKVSEIDDKSIENDDETDEKSIQNDDETVSEDEVQGEVTKESTVSSYPLLLFQLKIIISYHPLTFCVLSSLSVQLFLPLLPRSRATIVNQVLSQFDVRRHSVVDVINLTLDQMTGSKSVRFYLFFFKNYLKKNLILSEIYYRNKTISLSPLNRYSKSLQR